MLDPILSTPARLRICGYLAGCEEADFQAVQTACEVSASSLSKQVTVLVEHDLVVVRKVASGRYTKTRLGLSDHGRQRLSDHVRALREIAEQTTTPSPR